MKLHVAFSPKLFISSLQSLDKVSNTLFAAKNINPKNNIMRFIIFAFSIVASSLLIGVIQVRAAELIANGDFDSGFTEFTSDYSFISSGVSTSPQTFGIRTSSQSFNPNYDVFVDHTSGSGNMMLIDGSASPTAGVWQETVSVVAGTNYTFSAWGTPADSANTPTLRFFINSAQIGSDLSLITPAGNWQNFTNVWNSGLSTTATITIVDLTTVGFGNDFALDDISFTGLAVPEPSTVVLALAAFGTIPFIIRRRSTRRVA